MRLQSSVVFEMINATVTPVAYINKLISTLEAIDTSGKAPAVPVRTLPSGQKVVTVSHGAAQVEGRPCSDVKLARV